MKLLRRLFRRRKKKAPAVRRFEMIEPMHPKPDDAPNYKDVVLDPPPDPFVKSNECRYCRIPMLAAGERHVPDRVAGRWFAYKLLRCSRCGWERTNGGERLLTAEEAQALGLAELKPIRDIVG